MKIRRSIFVFMILLIGLVGCKKETPVTELIYDHLEESVALENDYAKYQEEIFQLEQEEQDIYKEITELTSDDFDKIVSLSEKAIEIIKKREELIELEQESISSSKEEFLKVEPLIEKLEEDEVKINAEKMFDQMIERYATYDELFKAYQTTLKLEREFYEMYKDENLDYDTTSEHIDKLNENYDMVIQKNEAYNGATREYNELKKEFYLSTDLDIVYE